MNVFRYMLVLVLVMCVPEVGHASKSVREAVESAKAKHYRVEPKEGTMVGFWKNVLGGGSDIDAKKTVTIEENIEIQKKESEQFIAEPVPEDTNKEVTEGVWHVSDEKAPEPTRFVLYQDATRGIVPIPIASEEKMVCEDQSVTSLLKKIALLEREKEALRGLVARLAQGEDIGK